MPISSWRPVRICLIWLLPVIFLIALINSNTATESDVVIIIALLWAITTGIAWIITWKWMDAREKQYKTSIRMKDGAG